eukprot:CAMPEP_0172554770 /NCGR_PEP_ID=MMETSP1067-20121228/56381_1 /TAXON_ID=265564 ORGANISM="Thalassiosira punctigera, Strain Tpunct2005C2" /NCGR_SAMPLE_ID=MMETSP1067 /ASSEMBLY_ACC=CAM_ASM_000444 /LENGTH=229 /DNA_ID=CAMNT_0013343209 /DNA_START=78 /DNA_END=767 /DNA_ORIENTATION=-
MPRRMKMVLPSIIALAVAISELPAVTAFAPSRPLAPPPIAVANPTFAKACAANNARSDGAARIGGLHPDLRRGSSLPAIPPQLSADIFAHHNLPPPSLSCLPSVLSAYEEEAFADQVSLSDLTSDPTLRGAFAASVVAVVVLFVAKAFVNRMDEAVERVALDFDRVMRLRHPKRWEKFAVAAEIEDGVTESEEYRIRRIVEEMERLQREEPEFVERVMRDVERMGGEMK